LVSAVTNLVTALLPALPKTIAKTNRRTPKYQATTPLSLRVGDNVFQFSLKKMKKACQPSQTSLNPG
jgi:hypothetical protein